MKTITANISSANGSPNKWVEVGLFGFITTLFSLLIALVDTKNRIAAVIASIAYLSVLVYMFIFGYAEYAVYGFLVFIAVGMTRLFIKKDEDTVR
jgi:presenilin-like A22 family membrane protease